MQSGPKNLNMLASNVIRLSHILTRERENLSAAYLKDRGLREAYQAYFLPPNRAKIQALLRAIPLYVRMHLKRKNIRILDLGCGPGAALLGVLEFFAEEKTRPALTFVAVDQVYENLKLAEKLFNASRSRLDIAASLKTVRSGIEHVVRLAETSFDLIILSNVLNEMFVHEEERIARRTALAQEVLDRFLSHDGCCIIIEPALRETSRELLEVRDGLIERNYAVISPCLRQGKCPALADPKDWCHEDLPWDPPEPIRELDKLTGLRKDALKFSYLVLGHSGETGTHRCGESVFRVVSEPLISKGKRELYLCGESGRHLAVRLDKDAAPQNEVFDKLRRGDTACFEGMADGGKRIKITKETVIVKQVSR